MIDTLRGELPDSMTRAASLEPGQFESMATGALGAARRYARANPEAALLWAVGIGFVLGWKLKPSW